MAELQRSAMSFRRQGSSGLVWDDKFLRELDKMSQKEEERKDNQQEQKEELGIEQGKPSVAVESSNTIERSRSNGGRAFRTGKVSPAIEPPSPRVSACGFCSAFGKRDKNHRRPKSGKRRK